MSDEPKEQPVKTHVYTIMILNETDGTATNFTVKTNHGDRVVEVFTKVWNEFFDL